MTVKKSLENRIKGWLPKEPKINIIQERQGKLYALYHAAILIMAGLTIVFPFALYFFPSNVLPYVIVAFITMMTGAGLVVMAGTLRFWGKIALVIIVFGVLLGLITGLALH